MTTRKPKVCVQSCVTKRNNDNTANTVESELSWNKLGKLSDETRA